MNAMPAIAFAFVVALLLAPATPAAPANAFADRPAELAGR